MKILFLLIASFSFIDLIFCAIPCRIEDTKDQNITNFEGCQSFSKAISENVCCYVQGKGENETSISACAELSPKVNDSLKDLKYLEGFYSNQKKYYLNAICETGKEIGLCDPDDRKSDTPLSAEYCANFTVVRLFGADKNASCCYLHGKNGSNNDVYSCIGKDSYIYTEDELKSEIENGDFKRLGVLSSISIECLKANFYSISIIYLILTLLYFL